MNAYGSTKARELADTEYSNLEYRNKLTRIHNMSMLCHRSAEIDQGTLLYFSVNNMYLGDKDFFLLLFSEMTPPREDTSAVRDVYGQVFTYAIIEEVVKECFSGHYTFYSCELDGRLAVIVCFLYGLAADEPDIHFLYPSCEEVSRKCRELYDMEVVSYISEAIDDIYSVSIIYHKLLNQATLHRYTERKLDSPVVVLTPPPREDYSLGNPLPFRESAQEVANALVSGGEFHGIVDNMLDKIVSFHANSTEDLNVRLGDYFDTICNELGVRGVKLKYERLREEQFAVISKSRRWREPVQWLYRTLDSIANERRSSQQQSLLTKLELARRYIDERLDDPNLSVSEIGAAAGMNPSFISTAFSRQLGVGVSVYIRKLRLERSLSLLNTEGPTIAQVSQSCGFGSVETFHRVFKAEYGITPAKLKRSYRE